MSRRWKLAQRKALQRSRWVDMQCTVENLTSPCLASAWPRHITAAPAQALELKDRSENQIAADRETVARNSTMAKDTASKDDFESQTYLKVTWRLLPFIGVCYFVAYLDRVNVGFAKLQMLSDLKLSEVAYGFGAGVFFVGYFLFEVPSNLIMHRVGARAWIARIMITWGIISAAMAFIGPMANAVGISVESMFYVMRFLLGAAEAGFFPGIILYFNYWYPSHRQSNALSLLLAAQPMRVLGLHRFRYLRGRAGGWSWSCAVSAAGAR